MDKKVEQPIADDAVEKQTIKKPRAKKFANKGDTIKVDLSEQVTPKVEEETIKVDLTNANQEQEATDVAADQQAEPVQEVVEKVPQGEEAVQDEQPAVEEVVLEEVTEEPTEALKELVEEVEKSEVESTQNILPENIQKLVDFMEETGGTIEDYVELNRDIDSLDNMTVLQEYYKKTKPHLSAEEISFMMEDEFDYDEDADSERDVKRKKLAFKEQVAKAKAYLDGQKSKYYEEIKAGSRLTPEAQKAINFFNRYNKESEETKTTAEKQKRIFEQKTNQLFNDSFKGFEYKVGDKTYRLNVKDAQKIKETQSDIGNMVKMFLAEDNTISDAKGYHKSLFTAMNPDMIAQHFYEQGKADAVKDSVAKAKNVNMDARKSHGEVNANGVKFRVLSGESSNDFKVKIRNKN
jgi:hypothetical protein